ncbi:MAG: beta-agarase, partial [Verrucomicrobiota bacterium]
DDLRQQAEEEERYLTDNPAPKNFSKFGGWKDGPKFEATGFFRTQKHEGVWWLVDPDGYLFWSHGVGCVHPATAKTGTTDRESYFEWLPEKDSDFGKFYNTLDGASHGYYKGRGEREVYNFTASNLYQKFGENWYDEFSRVTHARLRSWGMNTMAIASDKKLCEQGLTPYTETVWVKETRKIEASTGYWGGFHDVFDSDFRNKVREALASRKGAGSDPWCLGFFIENELSWGTKGSLATATLESPADQPAKQVFLADLKAKYDTIESLNESWETEHASWDALLESTDAPDPAKAEEDLNDFYEKIAITYFSTVREEMKAIAPNVMYLGCRLAWAMNDIVLSAAAEYTDVMSKNKYEYGVSDVGLPEGVDHPILIGEFHFGALDRGAMHVGICDATDQFHRAELYTAYLETALRNPFIVGTHWFQYGDQPPTGRGDGENYNVGLVDLCDRPFPEMIRTVSEMGRRFYDFRHDAAVNGGIVEP